jgi:hypothetical protein
VIRRAAIFVVALAGAVGGGVASARTSQPPRVAALRGFVCQQAVNPLNRVIGVSAVMRPVPGTVRMELRFQLLERQPGQWLHVVHGGDLGRWRHPSPPTFGQNPGDTWIVNKPVANLDAPAIYRFRVTFRWTGAS